MVELVVKTLIVGQMRTNCYLLTKSGTGKTIIVDPGDDPEYIKQTLSDNQLSPILILATHGHLDHCLGVADLQLTLEIPFYVHSKDDFLLKRTQESANFFFGDNDWISPIPSGYLDIEPPSLLDDFGLLIIETPGHTPGSVSFYSPSNALILVGDLLFYNGGIGRTDFSYSSFSDLQHSLEKILQLPRNTRILSGHMQPSTIGEESHRSFT